MIEKEPEEFSDETVRQAWNRANGHCECKESNHGHKPNKCPKWIYWGSRGRDDLGAWEAHHTNEEATLSNCLILCWDCHKASFKE